MRSIIFAAWTFLSTFAYGIVCISIGLFSQRIARLISVLWCRHLLFVAGVRTHVVGVEKLTPNGRYVVACNHVSAFDIPILTASLPLAITFMAKKELFSIPIFGWGMSSVGHFKVDRSNARKARASIMKAAEKLKTEDISVLVFPEGTRSATGEMKDFKSASFALVLESGVAVVPVALLGTSAILSKKDWKIKPGEARVIIGDPVEINKDANFTKQSLSETIHERISSLIASADVRS